MEPGDTIKVMVADDEPHIRALVAGLVATLGGEVVAEAPDGAQAIAQFERLRPEVVVLDINMPALRGFDVLKRIMALEPGTLAIMMSAQDTIDTVQACLELGARHYVLKDNRPGELYALFSEIWREFEAELCQRSVA